MNPKVNYNDISKIYNTRYEKSSLKGVSTFLIHLIETCKPGKIIEIGCGTAHWLNILSKYNNSLFGADYSMGMLNVAHSTNKSICFLNADANKLPLRDSSFDLIYVVNAIHHFENPFKFISDAYRYLKPGGTLCIIGMEPRESINKWYMYNYFPRALEIDLRRFPTFNQLEIEIRNSNFINISLNPVHRINKILTNREILDDHFADKRGASQLALLSDEEYKAGMNNIKSDILNAESNNVQIYFNTFINFYAIRGLKPL